MSDECFSVFLSYRLLVSCNFDCLAFVVYSAKKLRRLPLLEALETNNIDYALEATLDCLL
jgi:hypothetical protein